MKRQKLFWIRERDNPQLGTYFVCCGQLSKIEAKNAEHSLYGYNTMHSYNDEQEYIKAIEELKKNGKSVQ